MKTTTQTTNPDSRTHSSRYNQNLITPSDRFGRQVGLWRGRFMCGNLFWSEVTTELPAKMHQGPRRAEDKHNCSNHTNGCTESNVTFLSKSGAPMHFVLLRPRVNRFAADFKCVSNFVC
ncbi:hypothetical protein JTE90_006499 [Oedothorax gibbosus]|uniref:Uncharacterized protein n=1 Tax=Oedothorax gibbosus TaxID=931172 RepID=A0AAV6VPK3_9ARAC|nr:hypothetical protein JTE90_006499 [Oedothorax gibbosus]